MNIDETKQLLAEIAVIDGREVSDEAVAIWQDILQRIPLDIAQEAHKLSRQDSSIRYLEPKHIYSRAMQAAERLAAIEEQQKRQSKVHAANLSKPCPKCNHGIAIVSCDACCNWLWNYHKTNHPGRDHGDRDCFRLVIEKLIPITKTTTPLER
jgi:hypothetical protein